MAMLRNEEDVEIGITAGQKMISAMSGSLLTSLLGNYWNPPFFPKLISLQ